jgi:hypothetical protein
VESEGTGNRIHWKLPPSGDEITISQGGDFKYSSGAVIGSWNLVRDLAVYHRYTSEHLETINGGELTHVVFVPTYGYWQQAPGHTHTIQIYRGGNWGEEAERHPGTLIASQELDNADLVFFQENTITLETSVTIDASQELWIGYYCTDIDTITGNKNCAGADSGPCNNGLGNIILYDNRWRNYIDIWSDDYNWVIKGKVLTVDNVTVNIYFSGNELETNISETSFFHSNPVGEEHCYKVEVNCLEGGVSPLSNEFCIPGVGIKDNSQNSIFTLYPNPAGNELRITNYELRITGIEIFDVYGRVQKAESRKQKAEGEMVIDVSNLTAGVYFIRIIDKDGSSVQKFIKE